MSGKRGSMKPVVATGHLFQKSQKSLRLPKPMAHERALGKPRDESALA
jgi:hypothetical protein